MYIIIHIIMCIYNFTTNTKFNEIIKNQNVETANQN